MIDLLAIFFLLTPAAAPSSLFQSDSLTTAHVPPGTHPVVLRFAGDCLLAAHFELPAGKTAQDAFEGFDLLRSADVAAVNLECPITVRGLPAEKPFTFRMHPDLTPALVSVGVKAVNLANNHISDFGKVGLCDTFSYLDSAGIRYFGAGRNAREAHAPALFEVDGRSVALLGYYGGGEARVAGAKSPGVAQRTIEAIRGDILAVRQMSPKAYVVVNLHWGTEKAESPDPDQVAFAHEVVEAGADLIIGHHPHVLQGIERYRSGVIVYSLGNFIFGGNGRDTYDTGVFETRLNGGSTEYRLIPVHIGEWMPRELGGPDAENVLRHVRELSETFPESIFETKENK